MVQQHQETRYHHQQQRHVSISKCFGVGVSSTSTSTSICVSVSVSVGITDTIRRPPPTKPPTKPPNSQTPHLAHGHVEVWVHSEALALPGTGRAKAAQLLRDTVAVGVLPLPHALQEWAAAEVVAGLLGLLRCGNVRS
jgi:hypothetical protein